MRTRTHTRTRTRTHTRTSTRTRTHAGADTGDVVGTDKQQTPDRLGVNCRALRRGERCRMRDSAQALRMYTHVDVYAVCVCVYA